MSSTLHLNLSANSHQSELILKCNNSKKTKVNGYSNKSSSMNNNYHHGHHPLPSSVARRNERERNRVKMVNMGFATLRQHVPNGTKNKKMSKVETLRSAVEYIRELQKLLGQTSSSATQEPQNNENQCYNTNHFEQYSIQVPSSVQSAATTAGASPDGQDSCYSTMLPCSPGSYDAISSSRTSVPYSSGYNTNNTANNHSPSKHQLTTYHHLNSASPSPSIASSDGLTTGSSSSPYNSNNVVVLTSSNPHRSSINNLDPSQDDDELFDFVNWF